MSSWVDLVRVVCAFEAPVLVPMPVACCLFIGVCSAGRAHPRPEEEVRGKSDWDLGGVLIMRRVGTHAVEDHSRYDE